MQIILYADGAVAAACRRAAYLTSTSPSSTRRRSPSLATTRSAPALPFPFFLPLQELGFLLLFFLFGVCLWSIRWRAGGTSCHCSQRRQSRQALCSDRTGLPGSVPSWLYYVSILLFY
uniref:Uncharacterized protein n=1 Tax=Aegilops tauschii subsp. strangulata TaxID=200361 RepID=A0A453NKB1_AEGTS